MFFKREKGDFTSIIRVKKQDKYSEITDRVAIANKYVCRNMAGLKTISSPVRVFLPQPNWSSNN